MTFRRSSALILALLISCSVISCGKKTPLVWNEPASPAPPTDVRILQRPENTTLRWSYPRGMNDFDAFEIHRSMADGEFTLLAQTIEPVYVDTEQGDFSYRIIARGKRHGLLSAPVEAHHITPEFPLPALVNTVVSLQEGIITIAWPPLPRSYGVNLYREGMLLNRTPVMENTFALVSGKPGQIIQLRAAYASSGEGVVIEGPVTETLIDRNLYQPPAPEGLNVITSENHSWVLLFWMPAEQHWVDGYRIYRAVDKEDFKAIGTSHTPAFRDTAPPAGMLRYQVTSLGPETESPRSESVHVKNP